jgi:hypothetical protein
MENTSSTDCVRNEEVSHRVKEERNILYKIEGKKTIWIGYILRRNSLLKHITEEGREKPIDVKARRGRRRKQLLDLFKERR